MSRRTVVSTLLSLGTTGALLAGPLPVAAAAPAALPVAALPVAALPVAALPATGVQVATIPAAALTAVGVPDAALPAGGVPVSGVPASAAARCPSPGGARVAEATPASGAVAVLGHGWGHGMGMSQYGAQGAARLGCGYRTILGTYYRNSSVVTRSLDAPVLLTLARGSSVARLDAETGPVRWATPTATAVQPRGTTWTVTRGREGGVKGLVVNGTAGRRQLFVAGTARLTARYTGVVVKIRPTGSYTGLRTRWDNVRFRGSIQGIAVTGVITAGQGRTAVQKYLSGLAEVPVSWPAEALKAQVVAARTYLSSKYSAIDGGYVVRTTTADQVYRGFDQEKTDQVYGSRWLRAVNATPGQVIVDAGGRPIEAMYSSSMGGHTENRQYVYGRYGISYLRAVDDSRWDNASDNPYRSWSKGFSRASLARRFGFDSVTSWQVARRGSSERLAGVRITGRRAGRTVTASFTGTQARSKLGLRSPGFTFAPTQSSAATP